MKKISVVPIGFILVGLFFAFFHLDESHRENVSEVSAFIKKYSCDEGRNENFSHEIILDNDARYYSINYYSCMYKAFNQIIKDHSKVSLIVDNREFYQVKLGQNTLISYEEIMKMVKNRVGGGLVLALLFWGIAGFLLYKERMKYLKA